MDALLEPGLLVDVVLDGGWRRSATVTSASSSAVNLAPAGDPLVLPGQLRWCRASLEWRAAGAGACAEGMLHVGDSGLLRMVPIAQPLKVQRRRFVRVPAECTAAIVAPDAGRLLTRTVDLSVGGMLVRGAEDLPVGRRVRFALDLRGEMISGDGEVVRGTAHGERGVRFDEMPAQAERTLSRFVAERQRRRLTIA